MTEPLFLFPNMSTKISKIVKKEITKYYSHKLPLSEKVYFKHFIRYTVTCLGCF